MKKEVRDKKADDRRKTNYVLLIFSIGFLLAELLGTKLHYEMLGIFMLFAIAFFNTTGRIKMPSFDEEQEQEEDQSGKKGTDPISLICALAAAAVTLVMILLYLLR